MTTADAAMSLYLNMNQNVRGKPNENYAREFMELFCLGPTGPDGTRQLHPGRRRRAGEGVHRLGAEHRPTLADKITPNPTTGRSRSRRAASS